MGSRDIIIQALSGNKLVPCPVLPKLTIPNLDSCSWCVDYLEATKEPRCSCREAPRR